MKIARVAALLLLAAPAFALLRGTAERELTQRKLDIAVSGQDNGRIASDGTSFLTVWSESRYGANYDILGARLAPNGAVVDLVPLVLAATPSREQEPDVAWGRDRYFAIWNEDDRIRGRFIKTDGSMSDAIDIGTRSGTGFLSTPRLAFNGRVFLVAWFDSSSTAATWRGAVIDPDGRVLVTREIGQHANDAFNLVAMGGTFYFIHVDVRRVFATPLDDALNAGETILIDDSPHPVSEVRTASRGDEMLIAWTGLSPATYIEGVRLTRNGDRERAAFDTDGYSLQEIVARDDGYLLLYNHPVRGLRMRRFGEEADMPVAGQSNGSVFVTSAATNGVRTIALIRSYRGWFDVFAPKLSTVVIGEDSATPLVLAPRHQTVPDLATAGDLTLVAWIEYRWSENRAIIAGVRVDANGSPLELDPIEISGPVFGGRPRIATNGSDWLVIWEEGNIVAGRRIRHDGTFIDATPLVVGHSSLAGNTAVAWDGTSYIVTSTSGFVFRTVSVQTFLTRVPPAGNPAAEFAINNAGNNLNPAIAAGPNASLVVWTTNNQLHGVLVSPGNAITPVTFPAGFGGVPSVAWNRDAFLVAVDIPSYAGQIPELRWARVDAFGNVLESFSTINHGSAAAPPRVVPFGDHFLLLWTQQHLFGAILDRNGNLLDGPAMIAENIQSFSADGTHLATSHPISHPTHPSRVFTQSIEWAPEIVPRMRSARH